MEKGERPVIGRGNIPTQMDVLAMRTQRRTAASTSPAEASPMTKPAEPLPIPRNEGTRTAILSAMHACQLLWP